MTSISFFQTENYNIPGIIWIEVQKDMKWLPISPN